MKEYKDKDLFNMGDDYEEEAMEKFMGLDDEKLEFKNSKWCYDTPGAIQPDQVLHLLTTEELLLTLPNRIISPRTFTIKPQESLFLAGLGRIDCIDGPIHLRYRFC